MAKKQISKQTKEYLENRPSRIVPCNGRLLLRKINAENKYSGLIYQDINTPLYEIIDGAPGGETNIYNGNWIVTNYPSEICVSGDTYYHCGIEDVICVLLRGTV